MKLLLIGPQGSGKGTQGEMLGKYLNVPLISTGQVLRNIPEDSPWYKEINDLMKRGELVTQDKVASLLKERTSKEDCANGYIIDGWGRKSIDLDHFNPNFDKVLFIDIPVEESIKRIVSRRTCRNCGAVFNVDTMPPKVEGVCDKCGGPVVQREDDTEEAVNKRLSIFYTDTKEVIERFISEGKLVRVDGNKSPDLVFEDVKKALNI